MTDLEASLKAAEQARDRARDDLTCAEQAYSAANQEYSRALMAFHGVTPYRTIFMWEGLFWSAGLFADGDVAIFRVTTKNRRIVGDHTHRFQYDWRDITLTDRILVEGK